MPATVNPPSPKVEAVYSAAQSFTDSGERDAYLKAACKGDKALRQRVEELLAAAEKAREFFAEPAAAFAHSRSDTVILKKPGSVMRYFGDYEVEREIGRGGMGVIYSARQTSLDRRVAIKMILSGNLADENEVKRFQTEAEAAANLRHPNIVSIHEIGVHEGQRYYSMDLVEGGNLEERIRQEPLSPGDAAKCLKAVAEAVAYAHSKGILHRDLKPQNILLDRDGNPHVTDFGLAKRMESGTQLTLSGSIMGSPGFMAPEQAEGNRDKIDVRTDVYGLGALLYSMLTGRAPIQGDNVADTIRRVTEEEPVSPRRLNPKVAQDLETVCLKCLAKSPSERYASAAEVAEDLERFLNYEPVKARPAGAVRKTWTWWQKNPWKLVGLMGLTTLGLSAWIATLLERNRMASLKLQFPDADALKQLAPFDTPPALLFLYALPLFLTLAFITGRAFRRQLKEPTGDGEVFRSVVLPAHALAGATGFLGALVYLFQQIRFWVWFPAQGNDLYLGLHVVAVGCCFALAWIGLNALWEALGSHDSAVFKARVSERLKRQFRIEAERKWTFGQLLLVSGCLILALLLTTLLLFLVMDPSGDLPRGFARFALLGAAMTFVAHLVRRRMPEELNARRRFWFATTALFFFAMIFAAIRMSPLAPLTMGWAVGLLFSLAHFNFIRVSVGAHHATTDNGAKIAAPPSPGFRLRLALESFALLAVLLVLFHVVENWRGDCAWREAQQAITDAGIDTNPQTSLPPPISDEENFFTALDEAAFLRSRSSSGGLAWTEANKAAVNRIPDAFDLAHPRAFRDSFEAGPFIDLSKTVRWDEKRKQYVPAPEVVLNHWLEQHEVFFGPIVEAAKRPGARFPYDPDKKLRLQPFPNIVALRTLTLAFTVRAQFEIDRGDGAAALENIRVVTQCRRMLKSSPSLVAGMIAIQFGEKEASLIREGIRQKVWSTEQLAEAQAGLADSAPLLILEQALRAEMGWLLEFPQELPFFEIYIPYRWRRDREWLWKPINALAPKGWRDQMKRRAALIYLDHVLPGIDVDANRVHLERHAKDEEAILRLERRESVFDFLALIGVPNFQRAMQTAGRAQALVDMTRIACALERFRLARGAYPANLAELTPEWIDAIPPDVTNGEPLIYRAKPDGGFTLYSRGLNQKDDGAHTENKDGKPKDWVWAK